MILLSKEDILRGLSKIDEMAKKEKIIIELSIYGGAALSLSFDLRDSTRDVDAVVKGSPDFLRKSSQQVALDENWPMDWLNDGVKGFTSENEQMNLMEKFNPTNGEGGLRVQVPSVEYIFAMKCMAMRTEDESHDISDIKSLVKIIGLKNYNEAIHVIEDFYPKKDIPQKTLYGIQEIMDNAENSAENSSQNESKSHKPR